MATIVLALSAACCVLVLVVFVSSMPLTSARARGRPIPQSKLLRGPCLPVGFALLSGITMNIWLALEFADFAGPLGQRSLLEQLLPLTLAFALAVCLIALPWRPCWVAAELRRLGIGVPIAALVVLLIDGAYSGSGVMAVVSIPAGMWAVAGALLLMLGRTLGGSRAEAPR